MAERFGGKYSPTGAPPSEPGTGPAAQAATSAQTAGPFAGKRRDRAGARSNILFFAPVLIVVNAFRGDGRTLVLGLCAFALMMLAAWLTREGIAAQQAYDARTVARRPAIPRKIFGAVLIGAGLVLGGMMSQPTLLYPALFGLLGAGLHLIAFGPDPLRDKGMAGVDAFQTDRVARAVDEGEKYLAAMKDAILRAGDRQMEARVERFIATARTMFRGVENDPGDLTAARKYMGVYLMGARDATVKFADLYAQSRDATARAKYDALLTDLETNFAARTQALLSNNRSDLDVEIDVLRERLQREG